MKKHTHEPYLSIAVALVAFATFGIGAIETYATGDRHDYKSMHQDLFKVREFRELRRKVHAEEQGLAVPPKAPVLPKTPAAKVPCDVEGSEALPVKPAAKSWNYEELPISEKATLREQLRTGGCPQDALPGYRELCEELLAKQKRPKPMRGLKNSEEQ